MYNKAQWLEIRQNNAELVEGYFSKHPAMSQLDPVVVKSMVVHNLMKLDTKMWFIEESHGANYRGMI